MAEKQAENRSMERKKTEKNKRENEKIEEYVKILTSERRKHGEHVQEEKTRVGK